MKVFFDTNVYVAEALLGTVAEELLAATQRAAWRIYASTYVLDELERDDRSDYLATNDRHLLNLNPYEGLQIVSMTEYHRILVAEGLIDTDG